MARPLARWMAAAAMAAMAAGCGGGPAAVDPPFAIRGVIEGYYGLSWTLQQTEDMLAFMGAHGMNTFVYAPKFDQYQRQDWRTPYPPSNLSTIAAMVRAADAAHVRFVYSLSPGLSIVYSSGADRAALLAKFAQLRSIGVHWFMLSFDDVSENLASAVDQNVYHDSISLAQVDLTNYVYTSERAIDPSFHLMFTPTEYWGIRPTDVYFQHIAKLVSPIDIVWTGPGVVSPTITAADAEGIDAILHRRVLIWYNYPVNDWTVPSAEFANPATMQPRDMFLGPVQGLAPDLGAHVSGLLSNPMLEPYASEIPLQTIAAYLLHPGKYRSEAAWAAALDAAGGRAAVQLRVFASALSPYPEIIPSKSGPLWEWSSTDRPLDATEARLLAAYRVNAATAVRSAAYGSLRATFSSWIDAAPRLAATGGLLPNAQLAQEIAPWVAWMPKYGRAGLDALRLLSDAARHESTAQASAAVSHDAAELAAAPIEFGGELPTFLHNVSQAA